MRGEQLRATELLDDGCRLARRAAAPWLGVLWLLSLPFYLLELNLYYHALLLGADARHYGNFLDGLAWLALGAWLLALYARLVFVRACVLGRSHAADAFPAGDHASEPGWAPLRTPWAESLTYLCLAAAIAFVFYLLLLTFVFVPIALMLAGIAPAVAFGQEKLSFTKPFSALFHIAFSSSGLWWLILLLAGLFVLAWCGLCFAFGAGFWLSSALGGLDCSAWTHLFLTKDGLPWPSDALPRMLVCAGALWLLEPLWLAASLSAVRQLRARESGEDLRAWFGTLQKREAA